MLYFYFLTLVENLLEQVQFGNTRLPQPDSHHVKPESQSLSDMALIVNVCIAVENHNFYRKTHYFNDHFQKLSNKLPPGP